MALESWLDYSAPIACDSSCDLERIPYQLLPAFPICLAELGKGMSAIQIILGHGHEWTNLNGTFSGASKLHLESKYLTALESDSVG